MFHLVKHYFDGIDQAGNTIILYAAQLNFFGFKIPFSSYILCEKEKAVVESGCLKKADVRFEAIPSITMRSLNVSGKWGRKTTALKEILYEQKNKQLIWDCHTPKAEFSISINDKKFNGLGYCETLHLSFYPWKLPIEVLKWGRFLSAHTTIVWIEWIGPKPLKKVFWNGKLCDNAQIVDDSIVFAQEDVVLLFEEKTIIKNNPLAAVANKHALLKIIFPKRFLQTQEIKYTAAARLLENGMQKDEGHALFEIVKWKK